jgi:hypothetical protein
MDRSSRSLALTLALVGNLGGCASAQNTPQRDYVWEMGRDCDGRYRDWSLVWSASSPRCGQAHDGIGAVPRSRRRSHA